jgi:hypothetical protein
VRLLGPDGGGTGRLDAGSLSLGGGFLLDLADEVVRTRKP